MNEEGKIAFSQTHHPEEWPVLGPPLSTPKMARLLNLAVELASMVLEDERLERAPAPMRRVCPKTSDKARQFIAVMAGVRGSRNVNDTVGV